MEGFKSQAFSSQNTLIQIEDKSPAGGAAPLTISAMTKAQPAVGTAAVSPETGEVMTISGSDWASLDGKTFAVEKLTDTTFALVGSNTTGESGAFNPAAAATPSTMLNICEAKTFTGFDGQSAEIDVTTLCSEAKEYLVGLQDFGNFNFTANLVPGDPGLDECEAAKADGLARWFRVILPQNMGMYVFTGFVRQKTITGGVGAAVDTSVVLRISGEPIYVVGTPA
jgi:hypothetical protein